MPIGVHPTNLELLLDLHFRRSITDLVDDWAAPLHPITRNPGGDPGGPAWTDLANNLTVLDFNAANPDWLEILAADSIDLNFTDSDFSFAAWIKPTTLPVATIMCRDGTTDGWTWQHEAGSGAHYLTTCQGAGINQTTFSAPGDLVIGTWCFVGATRDGAVVKTYKNGVDTTTLAAVHVNPLTAAGFDIHIGVQDDELASELDSLLGPRLRAWGRCVPASQMLAMFEMERALFNV
ncbi:MAG TPA: LamG-like jellyroll fold domain-containing protein [Dehalococcoidales bacterium]|nr:LamG-like jellyroll fold domain-containing protein [Dehalococcoidales bacterium]